MMIKTISAEKYAALVKLISWVDDAPEVDSVDREHFLTANQLEEVAGMATDIVGVDVLMFRFTDGTVIITTYGDEELVDMKVVKEGDLNVS